MEPYEGLIRLLSMTLTASPLIDFDSAYVAREILEGKLESKRDVYRYGVSALDSVCSFSKSIFIKSQLTYGPEDDNLRILTVVARDALRTTNTKTCNPMWHILLKYLSHTKPKNNQECGLVWRDGRSGIHSVQCARKEA